MCVDRITGFLTVNDAHSLDNSHASLNCTHAFTGARRAEADLLHDRLRRESDSILVDAEDLEIGEKPKVGIQPLDVVLE